MKVAIMQPYLFPYIGYFQLINAVDCFVFYDDVNYIKKGWVNRNKILSNNKEYLFTVPLVGASQNKKINEIDVLINAKWKDKFLKNIRESYSQAPFFNSTYELLSKVLNSQHKTISKLAISSILHISKVLELTTKFERSSLDYPETKELKGAERLIEICKSSNADTYINPIGGQELYNKKQFINEGIELCFLKSKNFQYKQFDNEFVPWLSIIDVLMFNSKAEIKTFLNNFNLL